MSEASIDATHDPNLRSWIASANLPEADFPIQNLPFGRFRLVGTSGPLRIGVAIGNQVLDLTAAGLLEGSDMNAIMSRGVGERRRLRREISELLRDGGGLGNAEGCLVPRSDVEVHVPCEIGDDTDFYTGIHHATTVGKLFRPDNPLMPNYKWLPVGYHGRSSSIAASGDSFPRPYGQTIAAGAAGPKFGPCERLDYELEVGIYIGSGNPRGTAVSMAEAESHVFGVGLLNDWSARDIQSWEYQPLGPFLAKNFATTVSPWVVTIEALAPFRGPFQRPHGDPAPSPSLDSA